MIQTQEFVSTNDIQRSSNKIWETDLFKLFHSLDGSCFMRYNIKVAIFYIYLFIKTLIKQTYSQNMSH